MKRVLFVIPSLTSYNSFLREVETRLASSGIEVHCACSRLELWGDSGAGRSGGLLHNIELPRGLNPISHLRSAVALRKLVKKLKPDLIHAHFSAAVFTTAVSRRANWGTTIGTFHGLRFPLSHGIMRPVLKCAESLAARRLDGVWVLTKDDLDELHLAAPRASVSLHRTFGLGCDLGRFDRTTISEPVGQGIRKTLGIHDGDIVFAFVGRFVKFKGFDLVVGAFEKVLQRLKNAKLLLIGAADPMHATGLTEQERLFLQTSPQIVRVGFQTRVEEYLANADIFVLPSVREGMSVSVMEALAMGVPVITRDTRGCREIVRDHVDGIVMKSCTTEQLASEMMRLATDGEMRRRMSRDALAGRARFDRRHFVDEQVGIYQRLLSPSEN